ncbi:MAG TPA: asparagine synthase-related protein, partial [Nocardioides sp.]|nr:asparagine synthase-related protein [Nocardioides sp.]
MTPGSARSLLLAGPWSDLGDGLFLSAGPAPVDVPALAHWLRGDLRGPVPLRQGFVVAWRRPDASVLVATSPRWEQSALYAEDRASGTLVVGTHPRDVITALSTPPPLDVTKLADLVALYDAPDSTVFAGVARLPLGHVLEWSPGTSGRVRRWFRPETQPDRTIRLEDAPGLVRTTIAEAVAASLPDSGDVGATLSGGLDSTMVTATAARLLQPAGRSVDALTHVPLPGSVDEHPSWEPDDSPYVRALVGAVPGIRSELVVNSERVRPIVAEQWLHERAWHPSGNPSNQAWINEMVRRTETRGHALLLTGTAGNATFSRPRQGILLGLRRAHDWPAVVREARRRYGAGLDRRRVVRQLLRDTLPPAVLAWRRGRTETAGPDELPVLREQLSEAALADLATWERLMRTPPTRADWLAMLLGDDSRITMAQQMSQSVWVSDPLSDPALIALAARLPEEAWLAGGRSRGLARAAAAGVLPDAVRLRTTYGSQGADIGAVVRGHEQDYRDLLDRFRSSPTVPRFVDLDALERSLGPALSDPLRAVHWH